jgi:hypothetical protein
VNGDCICVSCGVVSNRECQFQSSTNDFQHSSLYSPNANATLIAKIKKKCMKYDIDITDEMSSLIIDWYTTHNVTNLNLAICVIYLFESCSQLSNSMISRVSKKMNVSHKEVYMYLKRLIKNEIDDDDTAEDTHISEWMRSLQKECIQMLNESNVPYSPKDIQQMKLEFEDIIKNKASYIFHCSSYIVACVIKRILPSAILIGNHNRHKILKIYKLLYN